PSLLQALTPVFNLNSVRPVFDTNSPTDIYMYFTLYGILGVVSQWWMNEFISWDPIQCGADKITLPKEKFWLPDIVINEFMEENKAPTVPYVGLYSDGTIHDSLPVKVVSSCNLNIYTFPFDIQNCSMTFNSYIYYAMDIKIFSGRSAELITELSKLVMTTKGEWELLDITVLKQENNDTFGLYTDKLQYDITVRRRSTMYVVNLLLPSCFLITVDLFSFLLPPQSTDRSSFKMTLILGYTVFLLLMNDLLPVTGNSIPLINVFFTLCLALMVASLLETILITNLLCCSADLPPVPGWFKFLVLKILGFLVCMPRKKKRKSEWVLTPKTKDILDPADTAVEDKALQELQCVSEVLQAIRAQVERQKESQSSEDWLQVGFVIDRLLFGIYIISLSVSFITIIVIWVKAYKI
uniref:Uncharacterized protein n=1 Tax=Oryzias latipes TaxID=8090 RepID=A0A3P9L6R3_ORYLA